MSAHPAFDAHHPVVAVRVHVTAETGNLRAVNLDRAAVPEGMGNSAPAQRGAAHLCHVHSVPVMGGEAVEGHGAGVEERRAALVVRLHVSVYLVDDVGQFDVRTGLVGENAVDGVPEHAPQTASHCFTG